MKTSIFTVIALLTLTCSIDGQTLRKSQSFHRSGTKAWIVENGDSFAIDQNILIVKPKSDVQVLSKKLKQLRTSKLGFVEIQVPKDINIEKYAEELDNSGDFDFVEYSAEWKCCFVPNDSYCENQWYLDSISAPSAWDITAGNSGVKLAIIDTGVDAGHSDLGYGDDNYNHVSTTDGYNYVNNNIYSYPVYYHGTMVAGIAGAKTNNYNGVAGVSGGNQSAGITIIPYCVGNAASFNTSHIGDAIVDAVDKGAKVINISLHSTSSNSTDAAIEYAYTHGVTIVCAAGNYNQNSLSYPASHTYTIAVGAISQDNIRAEFSNYGTGLDIVAPGVNIYNTVLNNSYDTNSGTSFAAPQVAGAIALMLSINSMLTPDDIRDILHNTANHIPSYTYDSDGWNSETGYGRLNVCEAVKAADVIIGEHQLCGSEIYRIDNLPSDVVVSWSFLKYPSNNTFIQQNYPYQNQCIINIDNYETIDDTLCATIVDYNGHVQGIAKKIVSTGWNFYGTYQVREILTLNLIREGTIKNRSNIWLGRNEQAIISSPFFSNSTISYIPTGNPLWLFYNGSMTITFDSANQKIEIRGTSVNDCDNFMFKATAVFQMIEPLLSVSDDQIAISLEQQDFGSDENPSWDVEISNGLTGQKVYKEIIDGRQAIINTTNWGAGTYIVKTTIYDNVVTHKVVIK